MKKAVIMPSTKADYEAAFGEQVGHPIKFTDEQYARIKAGQLLPDAEWESVKAGPPAAPVAKYSGFEDDGNPKPQGAIAATSGFKSDAERTYATAFGRTPEDAPGRKTAVTSQATTAPWKAGNTLSALDYAASAGTRASNRARWDDTQNRWVTEFEDLGLTPTGLPRGGAVGKAIRDTRKV